MREHGPLPPDRVAEALRANHLLFLPTRSENFGHVILEALAAGCPVLLSDRTPWRNLARAGVGWDLPLDRPELPRRAMAEPRPSPCRRPTSAPPRRAARP